MTRFRFDGFLEFIKIIKSDKVQEMRGYKITKNENEKQQIKTKYVSRHIYML
jgi:hypothetical protein